MIQSNLKKKTLIELVDEYMANPSADCLNERGNYFTYSHPVIYSSMYKIAVSICNTTTPELKRSVKTLTKRMASPL